MNLSESDIDKLSENDLKKLLYQFNEAAVQDDMTKAQLKKQVKKTIAELKNTLDPITVANVMKWFGRKPLALYKIRLIATANNIPYDFKTNLDAFQILFINFLLQQTKRPLHKALERPQMVPTMDMSKLTEEYIEKKMNDPVKLLKLANKYHVDISDTIMGKMAALMADKQGEKYKELKKLLNVDEITFDILLAAASNQNTAKHLANALDLTVHDLSHFLLDRNIIRNRFLIAKYQNGAVQTKTVLIGELRPEFIDALFQRANSDEIINVANFYGIDLDKIVSEIDQTDIPTFFKMYIINPEKMNRLKKRFITEMNKHTLPVETVDEYNLQLEPSDTKLILSQVAKKAQEEAEPIQDRDEEKSKSRYQSNAEILVTNGPYKGLPGYLVVGKTNEQIKAGNNKFSVVLLNGTKTVLDIHQFIIKPDNVTSFLDEQYRAPADPARVRNFGVIPKIQGQGLAYRAEKIANTLFDPNKTAVQNILKPTAGIDDPNAKKLAMYDRKTFAPILLPPNELIVTPMKLKRVPGTYTVRVRKFVKNSAWSKPITILVQHLDLFNKEYQYMNSINEITKTGNYATAAAKRMKNDYLTRASKSTLNEQTNARKLKNIAAQEQAAKTARDTTSQDEDLVKELRKELAELREEENDANIRGVDPETILGGVILGGNTSMPNIAYIKYDQARESYLSEKFDDGFRYAMQVINVQDPYPREMFYEIGQTVNGVTTFGPVLKSLVHFMDKAIFTVENIEISKKDQKEIGNMNKAIEKVEKELADKKREKQDDLFDDYDGTLTRQVTNLETKLETMQKDLMEFTKSKSEKIIRTIIPVIIVAEHEFDTNPVKMCYASLSAKNICIRFLNPIVQQNVGGDRFDFKPINREPITNIGQATKSRQHNHHEPSANIKIMRADQLPTNALVRIKENGKISQIVVNLQPVESSLNNVTNEELVNMAKARKIPPAQFMVYDTNKLLEILDEHDKQVGGKMYESKIYTIYNKKTDEQLIKMIRDLKLTVPKPSLNKTKLINLLKNDMDVQFYMKNYKPNVVFKNKTYDAKNGYVSEDGSIMIKIVDLDYDTFNNDYEFDQEPEEQAPQDLEMGAGTEEITLGEIMRREKLNKDQDEEMQQDEQDQEDENDDGDYVTNYDDDMDDL